MSEGGVWTVVHKWQGVTELLSKFETDKIRDVLGKVNLDHHIKENYKEVESGERKNHLESNPNNNSMMQVQYYYLSYFTVG